MKTNILAFVFCLSFAILGAVAKSDDNNRFVHGEFKRLKASGYSETDALAYFFQLLNGMKSEDYVPGSINCSLDIIAANNDIITVTQYFSHDNEMNRPVETKERTEEAVFTAMRELTANLPSTIYNCYYIPKIAQYRWLSHLSKF